MRFTGLSRAVIKSFCEWTGFHQLELIPDSSTIASAISTHHGINALCTVLVEKLLYVLTNERRMVADCVKDVGEVPFGLEGFSMQMDTRSMCGGYRNGFAIRHYLVQSVRLPLAVEVVAKAEDQRLCKSLDCKAALLLQVR